MVAGIDTGSVTDVCIKLVVVTMTVDVEAPGVVFGPSEDLSLAISEVFALLTTTEVVVRTVDEVVELPPGDVTEVGISELEVLDFNEEVVGLAAVDPTKLGRNEFDVLALGAEVDVPATGEVPGLAPGVIVVAGVGKRYDVLEGYLLFPWYNLLGGESASFICPSEIRTYTAKFGKAILNTQVSVPWLRVAFRLDTLQASAGETLLVYISVFMLVPIVATPLTS